MVKDRLYAIHCPRWKLAKRIGVSEMTLTRWLRDPLAGEREQRVEKALRELEKEYEQR